MNSCLFCDLVNGTKKGFIVYQDDKTMVLLDIFPSSAGHLLVIPKKHGVTILDFSKEELGEVMLTVKKMAAALEKTFKTKTLTIGINHGEFGGVPHFHIHIIPRQKGDGGGIIQTIVKKEVKEKFEDIVTKIMKNI